MNTIPPFGIVFPPGFDPNRARVIKSNVRGIWSIITDPGSDEIARRTAKDAFDKLRRHAEAIGVQFDATSSPMQANPALTGQVTMPNTFAPQEMETPGVPTARQQRIDMETAGRGAAAMAGETDPTVAGQPPGFFGGGRFRPNQPATQGRAVPEGNRLTVPPDDPNDASGVLAGFVAPQEAASDEPIDDSESDDVIALRKALGTPFPKRRKRGMSRGEAAAMSFLAAIPGGFEKALSIIKLREGQDDRDLDEAVAARQAEISGLAGLASLTEQSRTRRATERLRQIQVQVAQAYREAALRISMHNSDLSTQRTKAYLDYLGFQKDTRERKWMTPTPAEQNDIVNLGAALNNIGVVRDLAKKGYGGPTDVLLGKMGFGDYATLAATLEKTELLMRPQETGMAFTTTEERRASAAYPSASDFGGRIIKGMDVQEDVITRHLKALAGRYGVETIRRLTGYDVETGGLGKGIGTLPATPLLAIPPPPEGADIVDPVSGDVKLYGANELGDD